MKYITLLFPLFFSGQTHRFIYEFQFKSDSLAKEFTKENMILDVNPNDVKFYPYAYAENDSLNKIRNNMNFVWDETLPAISRKNNSNTNLNYILLNDFFAYETKDEVIWKLSNETKTRGVYQLQKATTDFGGRNWTAWFNTEMNINEGPYKFRGLPGLIFEISDDRNNFSFSLVKSYHLSSTANTVDFLDTFGGQKPLIITEKILHRKLLEMYNDPLQEFREDFKKSNGQTKFSVMGTEIKSLEQFKELNLRMQARTRRENNPLELNKAIHYPK
ncbi:GLPGLI family protein [Chryseobacterium sp. MP_3.2]|uniref:GLPGLI family protein n=1 Tax=Chryseobacterium sp. MP_3.2 TaxID=3071712 RepID=UPI002E0E695C